MPTIINATNLLEHKTILMCRVLYMQRICCIPRF